MMDSLFNMLDYELENTFGGPSPYDMSMSFNSDSLFGFDSGSDLLSEIFNDAREFEDEPVGFGAAVYPPIKTSKSSSLTSRAPPHSRPNHNRNRVRMKAKAMQQHRAQQQQQNIQQQRQLSSLLSLTSPSKSSSSSIIKPIGQSLIHKSQQQSTVPHHNQQQPASQHRSSIDESVQQQKPVVPRVYFMQQSPKKHTSPKPATVTAATSSVSNVATTLVASSPAKQSNFRERSSTLSAVASQSSAVAPTSSLSASSSAAAAAASSAATANESMGISLLVKAPENRNAQKKIARENLKKQRRFIIAMTDHDYDKSIQKSLDFLAEKAMNKKRKKSIEPTENRKPKATESSTESIQSKIQNEQQRRMNELEDIASGFISEDVLFSELPNCLQDLVDGFNDSMLNGNATCDILEGLNDACNLMQNQFLDEFVGASDIPDFSLTEDELNQMIGLMAKEEAIDSAIESAMSESPSNSNSDKSEPESVQNSGDESDFFESATLALTLTTPSTKTKRNRKHSGSSSTRRKRRFSSRSSVASDSANSDSCFSSIDDSESNSSRPSSPDSCIRFGTSNFRKPAIKNSKNSIDSRDSNENVLYIGNIPNGVKKSDLRLRFSKFGTIERIKMLSNCAFLTFKSSQETRNAIKYGNDDRRHPKLSLGFGKQQPSRRQYIDLDFFEEETIDFRINGDGAFGLLDLLEV